MKLRTLLISAAAATGLFFMAGCNTVQTRITHNQASFDHATPQQQELIRQGKVALGFDPELVKLALGDPDIIRTKTEATGDSIVWIYTNSSDARDSLWFDDFGWYGPHYRRWHGGFYYYHNPYLYDYRKDREIVRVTFKEGKVSSIEQEQ